MSAKKHTQLPNGVKRVQGLVLAAHRADQESQVAAKIAAAAALYQFVVHGRSDELDALYIGYSPAMQGIMRQYFVQAVIDKFGHGGEWDATNQKWIRRNTPFIRFDKSRNNQRGGFEILSSDPKKNTSMSPTQLKHVKKAKQAIKEAGEDALNFDWKTAEQERQEREWEATAFRRRAFGVLKDAAQHAKTLDVGVNELQSIAKVFGLNTDQISTIREFFDDEKVDLTDDFEPLTEAEAEVEPLPIMIEAAKKTEENKPAVTESANA